jgi:antitoxin HigA-1
MPNYLRPIHPGEILQEELEELGLSASALAKVLCVPPNRITAILNQQRAITADTALRLARYFGTTAEFWLNLQQTFDLKTVRLQAGGRIESDVTPRQAA